MKKTALALILVMAFWGIGNTAMAQEGDFNPILIESLARDFLKNPQYVTVAQDIYKNFHVCTDALMIEYAYFSWIGLEDGSYMVILSKEKTTFIDNGLIATSPGIQFFYNAESKKYSLSHYTYVGNQGYGARFGENKVIQAVLVQTRDLVPDSEWAFTVFACQDREANKK